MTVPAPVDLLAPAAWTCAATTVLLGFTLVAGQRFLRNAATRHLVWVTAFLLVLALPLLQFTVSPVLRYRIGPGADAADAPTESPASKALPAHTGRSDFRGPLARLVTPALGTLWLCGAASVGVRFLTALVELRCLKQSSRQLSPTFIDALGIVRPRPLRFELRASDAATPAVPLTWGFLRPVVLLPRDCETWGPSRARAALLHELAHVHRLDNLWQCLALLACALHWFNPLVWRCARRMNLDAEIAADDHVLCAAASTADNDVPLRPSSYAAELLRFASDLRGKAPAALLGTAIASPHALEARILSIVNATTARGPLRSRHMLLVLSVGVAAALSLSALRPTFAGGRRERVRAEPPTDNTMADLGTRRDVRNPDRAPDRVWHQPQPSEHQRNPDVLPERELRRMIEARSRHVARTNPDVVGNDREQKTDSSERPRMRSADLVPE